MSDTETDNAWGQLVSLTDYESQPLMLTNNIFQIGRAFDCDLCLSENKLVSGHHCRIERDERSGSVYLIDSSTNGTLLNLEYKLTKGKRKELSHGDEFYVAYKKDSEETNVGYMYQDCAELLKEEGTQEYSPPDLLDATLEDSDCNHVSPGKKRKSADMDTSSETEVGSSKKSKQETELPTSRVEESVEESQMKPKDENKPKGDNATKCESKEEEATPEAKNVQGYTDEKSKVADSSSSKPSVPERDDIEENLQCMICQEMMHDCISLQPCLHSFCAGCYSDWMARSQECPSCRKKVERINKNHIVNNLIEAYLKNHPEKKRPAEDIEELNKKNKITHDMLYPNLKHKDSSSEYSDSDEDDDNNGVSGGINPVPPLFVPPPAAPTLFGFGTPVFGVQRAFRTVCRQCPGYVDPTGTSGLATMATTGTGIVGAMTTALNTVKNVITGAGNQATDAQENSKAGPSDDVSGEPSTSGDNSGQPGTSDESTGSGDGGRLPYKADPKVMPDPPGHQCQALQNHVMCQCCLQPMPDFRVNWPFYNMEKRPQQCGLCFRAFCHAYWGCKKMDCLGCLNKFKDMNFGRKSLAGLILDNQCESDIFRDYLDKHGMSVKDALQECCRMMDTGQFTVPAQAMQRFTSNTPVCYGCGMNQFKQLAFQYRKTWKKEDLPESAKNRPDCYWGHKCRTQRNKPHHAKNFNHICEQTRQF